MNSADTRRRWTGVICLGIAILMVVWGQLFLPATAEPVLLAAFWLGCFVFTISAVLIALADLRAIRRRTRAEKRELLEQTLRSIEEESRRKASEG